MIGKLVVHGYTVDIAEPVEDFVESVKLYVKLHQACVVEGGPGHCDAVKSRNFHNVVHCHVGECEAQMFHAMALDYLSILYGIAGCLSVCGNQA